MISVRALSRSYFDGAAEVRVLEGLDLEVVGGEFVALVGRSGSGKSTLLNVVGGLDRQYRGEVTVAGRRLTGLSDRALSEFRNESVGFVFQAFHLAPGLTAVDNVALPALFSRASRRWVDVQARAREALERVGLLDKAGRFPAQLSGGERQRVAIARAIFPRPAVLLCDEPTGNLDAATAEEVTALFGSLHRQGLTVVAVTHEERLKAAASRVLTLRGGRLE